MRKVLRRSRSRHLARRGPSRAWRLTLGWSALVVLATLSGVLLAALGGVSSPWAPVLLPAGLAVGAAVYRTPLRATATALLLAPLGLQHLGSSLKLAQVLDVLAVLALASSRLARARTPLPLPRPLFWGGVLVAVALVSTGTAVDTGLAVKQDVALVVGLALCATVVALATDLERWLTLVRALLLGSIAITVPALLSGQHLQARYGGSVVNDRPVGVFAQPNELGVFAMLSLLIALGLLLGASTWRDRWLARLSLLAAVAAMLVSLSRGAWIGSVVGVVVVLVWVPRARRVLAGTAVVLVLLGGLLGAFAPGATQVQVVAERLGSLANSQHNPYDDRPRIWREAVREISTRPVLGEGPGGFPVASTRSLSAAATVQADHAHDVLLTTAAETGLLGLGALLAFTTSCAAAVVRGVAGARRGGDGRRLCVLAGAGAAMAALIGEGVVDVTLRNVVIAQTVWVVLGLALAGAALSDQAELTASSAAVGVPSALTSP